jgi:hypothetical protein
VRLFAGGDPAPAEDMIPSPGSPSPRRDPLTDKNWTLFAARHYDNPQSCGMDEFQRDLKLFKYVKKAITRYEVNGELRERLILNHLTTMCNLFGPEPLVRMLFLKMEPHLPCLKPFLIFLSILPERVHAIGRDARDFKTDDIPMDQGVIDALRRI